MKSRFYSEVDKSLRAGERVVLATVTASNRDELSGGKIAFYDRRRPFFLNEQIEELYRLLEENNLADLAGGLSKPRLEKITAPGGIELEVYLEPVVMRERMIIFGAGHVARPLAVVAKLLDFEVTVVDDRKDLLSRERFPRADHLICQDFDDYCQAMQPTTGDYLVIATRGHQYDYQILKNYIRSEAKYIGMIGSLRKGKLVFEQLREIDGVGEKELERVHSPIGLYIGSETPQEIAVSIMAEVVMVRRGKNEL